MILYESEIEQIALDTLGNDNGYAIHFGPDTAEGPGKERGYSHVILHSRLRAAIDWLNPTIPPAREEAYKRVLRAESLSLPQILRVKITPTKKTNNILISSSKWLPK